MGNAPVLMLVPLRGRASRLAGDEGAPC